MPSHQDPEPTRDCPIKAAPVEAENAFAAPRSEIDGYLARFVAGLDLPGPLSEAIAYALLGGGKRLRPLLAWHCGVAAADDPQAGSRTLPAGTAVELIHAFSLVHDDLPAMDDDTLRRGRPTLHVHAGEAMAILAGDAMLGLAASALDPAPDPLRLSRELSRGTLAMIAGQVLDTIPSARPTPDLQSRSEAVSRIHDLKTGALIAAACRMGAIAARPEAGDDDPILADITAYAHATGRMYQVVDDLLDIEQPTDHAGKTTGKDAAAGKLTYPAVHGVEGSRRIVEELLDKALAAADNLGPSADPLKEMAHYSARRTR